MDHTQVAWTTASLENGAGGLSVRHNAYMQASFTSQNKDVIDMQFLYICAYLNFIGIFDIIIIKMPLIKVCSYSKHNPTFQQLEKCS